MTSATQVGSGAERCVEVRKPPVLRKKKWLVPDREDSYRKVVNTEIICDEVMHIALHACSWPEAGTSFVIQRLHVRGLPTAVVRNCSQCYRVKQPIWLEENLALY